MGKFSMSHPDAKDVISNAKRVSEKVEEPVEVIEHPEVPMCELLHCDGNCVDLEGYMKTEDLPDLSPLFQKLDEKILILEQQYVTLLNDRNETLKQSEGLSEKLDKLMRKSEEIEKHINQNFSLIEGEIDNLHSEMTSNNSIMTKEMDLLNNKIKEQEKKYMPYLQIAAAVLLSILLIKIF